MRAVEAGADLKLANPSAATFSHRLDSSNDRKFAAAPFDKHAETGAAAAADREMSKQTFIGFGRVVPGLRPTELDPTLPIAAPHNYGGGFRMFK
jgi:hypothetical protein